VDSTSGFHHPYHHPCHHLIVPGDAQGPTSAFTVVLILHVSHVVTLSTENWMPCLKITWAGLPWEIRPIWGTKSRTLHPIFVVPGNDLKHVCLKLHYGMPSSVSGQERSNPALWLATREGKMALSHPLRTTRCVRQETFPPKPLKNLLTKFVRSRCLDIGLVLFCCRCCCKFKVTSNLRRFPPEKKFCTRAVLKETPTNYVSKERL